MHEVSLTAAQLWSFSLDGTSARSTRSSPRTTTRTPPSITSRWEVESLLFQRTKSILGLVQSCCTMGNPSNGPATGLINNRYSLSFCLKLKFYQYYKILRLFDKSLMVTFLPSHCTIFLMSEKIVTSLSSVGWWMPLDFDPKMGENRGGGPTKDWEGEGGSGNWFFRCNNRRRRPTFRASKLGALKWWKFEKILLYSIIFSALFTISVWDESQFRATKLMAF